MMSAIIYSLSVHILELALFISFLSGIGRFLKSEIKR
jgi:hypothetical protein